MTIVQSRYRGTIEYANVYVEPITSAQYRGHITYQEVAAIIGLPNTGSHMGKEVGWMLGEISEDEHANGRPMLSALALSNSGKPGEGFFGIAATLGLLPEGSSPAEKDSFVKKQQESVYRIWRQRYT